MVASMAVFAISSGTTLARTARAAAGPKPPSEITAHQMRPRAGFPAPRFGARILASELTGVRVFANAQVGFALSGNHYGETLPARTTDGGKTWTIDGPQFHVDAADGAEAVSYVGLASQRTEFAYGSSVVDVQHRRRAYVVGDSPRRDRDSRRARGARIGRLRTGLGLQQATQPGRDLAVRLHRRRPSLEVQHVFCRCWLTKAPADDPRIVALPIGPRSLLPYGMRRSRQVLGHGRAVPHTG